MKRALTVNEAAFVAKRSRRTIYHWIEWGVLDYSTRYIDSEQLFQVEAVMRSKRGRPRKVAKVSQEA